MYIHPDPYLGHNSSMAWDASRRGRGPLPGARNYEPQNTTTFQTEEIDRDELKLSLATPLSPIQEDCAFSAPVCPLAVTVTIQFPDRSRPSYKRNYASSQCFEPSERTCRGLLRHIEHGSREFVTRKDTGALSQHTGDLRYVLTYRVALQGEHWAEKTFRSYQKQALTVEAAKEVARASHQIVGLFLRRHDQDFRLTQEPFQDYHDHFPTTKSRSGSSLSLSCIPRSRFLESTQSTEFVPGYGVQLTFVSRSRCRKQYEWKRTLQLSSKQGTSLNLNFAEDLLWRTSKIVNASLDWKREAFYAEHENCEWLEGIVGCQHFEEDALDIDLRVINNVGSNYDHLHRRIRSNLGVFRHADGLDCHQFLRGVQAQLLEARDSMDEQISSMNDFDFRIVELRGRKWKLNNAARFCLGPSNSCSRRTTEAILDRLQNGVADVLRGHDIAIHLAAYKRGHLVLDKALIAHPKTDQATEAFDSPSLERDTFISRLKTRIQLDLDMITKDTCSLKDIPEELDARTALIQDEIEAPPTNPTLRVFPLVPRKYSRIPSNGSFNYSNAVEPALDIGARQSQGDGIYRWDSSPPSTPGLSSGAETSPRNSLQTTLAPPDHQSSMQIVVAAEPLELEAPCVIDDRSTVNLPKDETPTTTLVLSGKDDTNRSHDVGPQGTEMQLESNEDPERKDMKYDEGEMSDEKSGEGQNIAERPRAEMSSFEEQFARTKPTLDLDEDGNMSTEDDKDGSEQQDTTSTQEPEQTPEAHDDVVDMAGPEAETPELTVMQIATDERQNSLTTEHDSATPEPGDHSRDLATEHHRETKASAGGSRSVSGSTLVSVDSADEAPFSPTNPSQVLKMSGWAGFSQLNRPHSDLWDRGVVIRTTSSPTKHELLHDETQDPVDDQHDDATDIDEDTSRPDLLRRRSIPTAGYLGLHETKFLRIGSHSGAVVARPTNMVDEREPSGKDGKESITDLLKLHKRAQSASAASLLTMKSIRPTELNIRRESDGVMSQVAMLFAGMNRAS